MGPGVGVLAGLSLLAAGALGATLLVPSEIPAFAQEGSAPNSAAVSTQSYDDPRSITVVLHQEEGAQVVVAAPGRVTASSCVAGSEVASGDSPLAVDGVPVVALATRVPLWRDLAVGDSGDDVVALQEELVRLGGAVPVDGRYRVATHRVVRAMLADRGVVVRADEPLARARVLWLPAVSVTVASCEVRVGSAVEEDDPVLTLPTRLTRLTLDGVPDGTLPGTRVLDVGEVAAPTDETGAVTDAAVLDQVAATAAFRAVVAADEESFETTWALVDPVDLVAVPPRALFGLRPGSGCVRADGTVLPVRVVTSSLGVTLVDLDGAAVPARVDLDVDASCP
ncbi:MAG TPA: peptidoglycan-binding domain-containing protein [Cellulomonas sp.]